MRVTFRQLQGFVAAAHRKSFSAAAREVAMTQPAFSQLMAALEGAAGVRLFDRSTRRMQLTEAGAQFLAMVERPLDDIEDACMYLREIASGKRGRLVFSSVGYGFVAAAIARFKAKFPHVAVRMLDDPSAILISRVLNREIDFGFGSLLRPQKELAYREVLRDELVAIVSSRSEFAGRRTIVWRTLEDAPLVLLPRESSIRELVDRELVARGITRAPDYEVQNSIAAASMARANLGVALLPRLIVGELNMRGLRAIPIAGPVPERSIGIISRADRPLSAAASAFVALLSAGGRR